MSKAQKGRDFFLPLFANLFILGSAIFHYLKVDLRVSPLWQGIYFVFGIILLLTLTFFTEPKRKFKNVWLGLFILWSFLMVFVHSLRIYPDSITTWYINLYLLSEGFIYILFGSLLYKLIICYLDKLPIIWVVFGMWLTKIIFIKSMTPILVLTVCLIAYFIYKKWFILQAVTLYLLGLLGLVYGVFIYRKFLIRLEVWTLTIKDIIQHPIIGYGFDKGLMRNFAQTSGGWMYRHQDFLNITRDLGLPALIFISIFLINVFKKAKFSLISVICLAFVIICSGQTTMYFAKNAVMIITFFALMEIENYGTKTI